MVSAVISAFLYLRIIVAMFMSGADDGDDGPAPSRDSRIRIPAAAGIAISLCVIVTLAFGLFPDLLVKPANAGQPALVQYDRPVDPTLAVGSTTPGG
jgi:NADH-quinone oxidoreductase subunit N